VKPNNGLEDEKFKPLPTNLPHTPVDNECLNQEITQWKQKCIFKVKLVLEVQELNVTALK